MADLPSLRATLAQHRWFYAQYRSGPAPHLISKEDFGDYPGLLLIQVVDDEKGGTKLATYWASREDFGASRNLLEERTGESDLETSGSIRDLRFPGQPLLKRLPTALLALAGLLGACETLQNHYSQLFEPPELLFGFGGIQPAKQLADSPFALNLEISNGSPRETALVRPGSVQLIPAGHGPTALRVPKAQIAIPPAGHATLPIEVPAQAIGDYSLAVSLQAKVGLLRGWQSSEKAVHMIEIWNPSSSVTHPLILGRSGAGKAWLSGTLRKGEKAPGGLTCLASAPHVPGLRFDGVQGFQDVAGPVQDTTPGRETTSVRWNTGPLAEYSIRTFRIRATGDKNTDWGKAVTQTKVSCSENQVKEKP